MFSIICPLFNHFLLNQFSKKIAVVTHFCAQLSARSFCVSLMHTVGTQFLKPTKLPSLCSFGVYRWIHRVVEVGKDLRSWNPTINPTPPPCWPLNHVLKCFKRVFPEHFQGCWPHHCPGLAVPGPDNPFHEEGFSNVQFRPLLAQLEAIFSPELQILQHKPAVH